MTKKQTMKWEKIREVSWKHTETNQTLFIETRDEALPNYEGPIYLIRVETPPHYKIKTLERTTFNIHGKPSITTTLQEAKLKAKQLMNKNPDGIPHKPHKPQKPQITSWLDSEERHRQRKWEAV